MFCQATAAFGFCQAPIRWTSLSLHPDRAGRTVLGQTLAAGGDPGVVREHLEPGGLFVFNVFDPLRDLADRAWSDDRELRKDLEFEDPKTGEVVEVWYRRDYDLIHQLLQQELIFRRLAEGGGEVSSGQTRLVLRYAGRFEMEHLLEAENLRVRTLYGGFRGEPYAGYGEQVWTVERPLLD